MTSGSWSPLVQAAFKEVNEAPGSLQLALRSPPGGRFYGAWTTLLHEAFQHMGLPFFVRPKQADVPDDLKRIPGQSVDLIVCDAEGRPVLVVIVQDVLLLKFPRKREEADVVARARLGGMDGMYDAPKSLPRFYGLCAFGQRCRIYETDVQTGRITPGFVHRQDPEGAIPVDFLDGAFNVDVLSASGFESIRRVVEDIAGSLAPASSTLGGHVSSRAKCGSNSGTEQSDADRHESDSEMDESETEDTGFPGEPDSDDGDHVLSTPATIGIGWSPFLRTLFTTQKDSLGPWSKLLFEAFSNTPTGFVVNPQLLPVYVDTHFGVVLDSMVHLELALLVCDTAGRPVMFVYITPFDLQSVHNYKAERQTVAWYDHLLHQSALPRLYAITASRTSCRVYCCDKQTGKITPPPAPRRTLGGLANNWHIPATSAWSLDIVSEAGFQKMREVVEDIVEMSGTTLAETIMPTDA